MLEFELKLRPNKNNYNFGSCTCNEILSSSPFLIGYNISKTQIKDEYKIDELNLYFVSSLNKQITKQYLLSKCYYNTQYHINSKL
jgi:hypothetical protein